MIYSADTSKMNHARINREEIHARVRKIKRNNFNFVDTIASLTKFKFN